MPDISLLTPKSGFEGISWPALPLGNDAMFLSVLYQIENSQWWEPSCLLRHQLHQLQQLLKHALVNVPFYEQRLNHLKSVIDREISPADLRQLPILTRNEVQQAGAALFSKKVPPSHGRQLDFSTSGSTGQPVTIKRTQLHVMFSGAMILRYHKWYKRVLSEKNVSIRTVKSKETQPRKILAGWSPCFETGPAVVYDISTPTDRLLEYLLDDDPAYLQTHPSTLRELIRLSRQQGRTPANLREARTFGELVDDELRRLCRKEWNVPLSDNYSSEEFGAIALQCPEHEHYHVLAENVLVEVLDDNDQPCKPGETGRVVATHLQNFATPLIRYELGDMAEVGSECPCGRGLPVLKRIRGRVRNLVALPNGQRVHPVFREDEILAAAPLTQYQVVQKSLEAVEVHYVMKEHLTKEQEMSLTSYFDGSFRGTFQYEFVRRESISKSSNNKFEVFRSEVSN